MFKKFFVLIEMSNYDYKKLRINNRVILRTNLDPTAGFYSGIEGKIIDIVYMDPTNLHLGVKSIAVKFDNVRDKCCINGIRSEDCHVFRTNWIVDHSLIFSLVYSHDSSLYHRQNFI